MLVYWPRSQKRFLSEVIMFKLIYSVLLLVGVSSASFAGDGTDRVLAIDPESPIVGMINFSVKYTLGKHEGLVNQFTISGRISNNDVINKVHLSIPIAEMSTQHGLRDCHMREALGMNYEFSVYPKKHLCNLVGKLSKKEQEQIVYPSVDVEILNIQTSSEQGFVIGTPVITDCLVKVTMHGVTKEYVMPVAVLKSLSSENSQVKYQVIVSTTLNTSDFGIIVKAVNFGPFEMKVDTEVKIQGNFSLKAIANEN